MNSQATQAVGVPLAQGATPSIAQSATPSIARDATPPLERARMLAWVRRNRAYSACLVTPPPESIVYARIAARFAPLALVVAFVVFAACKHAAPPWLGWTALAAAVVAAVAARARVRRYRSAPLDCKPAFVADTRREVTQRRRFTTVRHFATLAFETGAFKEFAVTAKLAAALTTGQVGVAWERDAVLLHFRRVEA